VALHIGILISGRGTNLQALIDACREPEFPARIALVLSNNAEAPGLARATDANIPTRVVDHRDFGDHYAYGEAVNAALEEAGVELVCLAGFMRLLSESFVSRWRDRIINVHPSLLPAFKGLNVHERVLAGGVRFSGCTVHFVRQEMDDGPVIVQSVVPVAPDDTPKTLAARVLVTEHRCYPLTVRLIAEGRVRVRNERVLIEGGKLTEGVMINPAID
jgi:phosphoribosylglycinamide formyltransferase-1